MKINVLSDLHLGFEAMDGPVNDADLVVLAGDIARPRQAVAWALRLNKPVLYVPGNHEFYGGSLDGTLAELQQLCRGTPVQVLERSERVIDGVRFLGAMLWSDFQLLPDPQQAALARAEALRLVRDFSRIRRRADGPELFTPEDAAALFARDSAWLRSRLEVPFAGPTVVVTHHAPSPQSIHPRFAGSLLNPCFVSDARHLMDGARVALWIHGHTHDSFDYPCQGTRVVCNPRGYALSGRIENARFDPDLVLQVPASRPGSARAAPAAAG